jgi:hypothetical protein
MTSKVKGLKKASVSIYVETSSGYSSHETFDSSAGYDSPTTLMNAVDELHRMLLVGGIEPQVLETRLKNVMKHVHSSQFPDGDDGGEQKPVKNLHGDGYPSV